MQTADYIIQADYVLTMDKDQTVIKDGAVAVQGNKIADIGSFHDISQKYSSREVIGGKNRAVLPGFVNTHTHAAMVYFRGMADDLPLKEWLEKHIWPAESKWLSPEFVYDAAELACLEMLKAGITTYNDMYFFEDEAGKAAKKLGMRAVLGAGILDFPTVAGRNADDYLSKAERYIQEWANDDLIVPCIAPHSTYTCGTETLSNTKELAEKYNVPIHMHLSETRWEVDEIKKRFNKRPVEYLEAIGFLGENVNAAHCVWVDAKEIEILARHNVGVSHCIESNLKLSSGIAPVPQMLKAGVKVSFGTDGAASNNDLNILSEMSTAAKVHKAISGDSTVLDAKTALLMATRWGADVLGIGDITGSIEQGKAADIVIMNLNKPHLTPLYDIYSHIVYSARASDVEVVFVNGRLVINDGNLVAGDEQAILDKAREWKEKIK